MANGMERKTMSGTTVVMDIGIDRGAAKRWANLLAAPLCTCHRHQSTTCPQTGGDRPRISIEGEAGKPTLKNSCCNFNTGKSTAVPELDDRSRIGTRSSPPEVWKQDILPTMWPDGCSLGGPTGRSTVSSVGVFRMGDGKL
eukprot:scaffold12494_cov159-Skeletonema_menzelii.AAC.2